MMMNFELGQWEQKVWRRPTGSVSTSLMIGDELTHCWLGLFKGEVSLKGSLRDICLIRVHPSIRGRDSLLDSLDAVLLKEV